MMGLTAILIPQYLGRKAPRSLRLLHRLVAGGIAVAVAMLLVTAAVLEGFWGSYVQAARHFHGDILVMNEGGGAEPEALLSALRADTTTAQISAESPFVLREGLLTGGGAVAGVILKAVDWEPFAKVHPELRIRWQPEGAARFVMPSGPLPVVLGRPLMGDQLPTRLFMPTSRHPQGESIPIQVVGSFESGLYDYDHQFVLVPRSAFATVLKMSPQSVDGVALRLQDPQRTWEATRTWQLRFPESTITNWSELNHNMFDALRLQRTTFVLLMSLFVIIALSNLVSVVGLQVYFRRQDAAILRLLGLTMHRVRRLIGLVTIWTAAVGVVWGALLGGIVILWGARTSLIALPETVYFVDRLPLRLPLGWAVGIPVGALIVAGVVVMVAVRRMARIPILKGVL